MIPFCALNVFWKVPSRSWKRGEGQRRRQRVPTNICQRILGAQKGGPGDLLSKMGELVRVHEIQKSIWRYYTSENADFHLITKLDLRKSQNSSNRSGACIVTKTPIFTLAPVAGGGPEFHSLVGHSWYCLHFCKVSMKLPTNLVGHSWNCLHLGEISEGGSRR